MYILKTPLVMSIYVLREKKCLNNYCKTKKIDVNILYRKTCVGLFSSVDRLEAIVGIVFWRIRYVAPIYLHLSFYKQVLYFQRNISQSFYTLSFVYAAGYFMDSQNCKNTR